VTCSLWKEAQLKDIKASTSENQTSHSALDLAKVDLVLKAVDIYGPKIKPLASRSKSCFTHECGNLCFWFNDEIGSTKIVEMKWQ
jgi:hypothetical protein